MQDPISTTNPKFKCFLLLLTLMFFITADATEYPPKAKVITIASCLTKYPLLGKVFIDDGDADNDNDDVGDKEHDELIVDTLEG
eukprot:11371456-Heterocapsa_arctica.AAC.1